MLLGAAAIIALCLVTRYAWGPMTASAKQLPGRSGATPAGTKSTAAKPAASGAVERTSAQQPVEPQKLQVVAMVNGEEISRNDLARYSLWHYGSSVLESMVNKQLIVQHCARANVGVTQKDVDDEINRVAQRFGLQVDQWLKMLKDERGINRTQYANDIIWPTLALRKLAAADLQVTPQELERATETHFGPAVKARLIACNTEDKARKVHAQAVANPDEFGELAKKYSDDVNSAAAKGWIQPIRKNLGDPKIEQAAFRLQPGEISQIIPVNHQFIILKCEGRLEAQQPPAGFEQTLTEQIRESKLRDVAGDVFKKLQAATKVENIYNDPQKSKQHPGVAAIVNDRKITTLELAEECIARHGTDVLGGMISRRVLEQALKQKKLAITQQDEDAEIARVAAMMGKLDAQKRPDINAWLKSVEEEQNIPQDIYIHDVIWPTVALKKLLADSVQVDDADLQKGFEANYGERVRCLAIVLSNQRLAQDVWEQARRANQTLPEEEASRKFGDLAEQHSVEATSSKLRGEVAPIQRHGGQPLLEQEAFALKAGELSGVIQVADKFVILRCQGRTRPVPVKFEEVRNELYQDIYEKKLRVAMSQEFDRLMAASQIDNYLAGTSQLGKKADVLLRQATQPPKLQQPGVPLKR
jgi:parvulin-like peptidyl-prolyl isomerase